MEEKNGGPAKCSGIFKVSKENRKTLIWSIERPYYVKFKFHNMFCRFLDV